MILSWFPGFQQREKEQDKEKHDGPATTCLDERYECRTINDVLRRDNLIKSKLTK
jgi:hypothetical protein